MKTFIPFLLVVPAIALALLFRPASAPAPAPNDAPAEAPASGTPLAVLELFTSQGCSSCPPADALLSELNERAAAGEPIIALSYHVDYWNYLGWKDPFSSPYFSARQTDYTERLRARTYTPQLVVNGRSELVGSRRGEVTALVDRTLERAKASIVPELTTRLTDGGVEAAFTLPEPLAGHRVSALLVQHHARSAVKRGENRGRDLSHHNVVRTLEHAPATANGSFTLALPAGLTAGDVAVVLLVQDEDSHAIVGAARAVLTAR